MSYEFKRLADVASIEEFPEGANVLIEHQGNVKRCAAGGLGGGSIVITEADFVETALSDNSEFLYVKVSDDLYEKLEKVFPSIVIKIKSPYADVGDMWSMISCLEWVNVPAGEGAPPDIPPSPPIRGFVFTGIFGGYIYPIYRYIVIIDPELEMPVEDQGGDHES